MPAIITDSFDYNDIVRVLDLDEAFVHHQIDALQPKYWRIVIKTKPKGLKIFAPVMVSGNRGIDYMIYMLSRDWQITKKQRLLDYMYFGVYRQTDGFSTGHQTNLPAGGKAHGCAGCDREKDELRQ